MKTRIGILGYGNLGRGVQAAVKRCDDMELVGIFTRRDPASLNVSDAAVISTNDIEQYTDKVDVMILCGGSAVDLPEQTPHVVKHFNVVDSFDTHSKIPEHFSAVDEAAKSSGHIGIISIGWDPGLFSVMRLLGNSILVDGADYTFWGKGVSQGHSDAVRRIPGVANAKQYTIPVESALEAVRAGEDPELSTREKHTREVFVVAEDGADQAAISEAIVTMPAYFDEYDTTVVFIDADEFEQNHSTMAHGGFVLRSGRTGDDDKHQLMEFSLKLDSNPEFTSSVLVAYARAAHRLAQEGATGCKTIFDVPIAYTSPLSGDELRAHLL